MKEIGQKTHSFEDSAFKDYLNLFVQRVPKYVIRYPFMEGWATKHKPLGNKAVQAHLEKKYAVGCVGRWYPEGATLDIDHRPAGEVEEIRDSLGMDESNSMLLSSESKDSFHLLFKPVYNSRPPTLRLYQDIARHLEQREGIDAFPKSNEPLRLPFGYSHDCVDESYRYLDTWQRKLYWWMKLDEYDLSNFRGYQLILPFEEKKKDQDNLSWFNQGMELLSTGLVAPSTRNESQAKVIYHLWRLNIPQREALQITWGWIQKKHNGFSMTIIRYPHHVYKEIQRQIISIYDRYERQRYYPDTKNNLYNGYICKPDLNEIIMITGGNLPRSRFLYQIIKYAYPRRFRRFLGVHRNRLRSWASTSTELKYLNEFDEMGIIKRGTAYSVGLFSKSLNIKWPWRDSNQAILYEGRAVDTFDQAIRLILKPRDYRDLLIKSGAKQRTAYKAIERVYESEQKRQHIE